MMELHDNLMRLFEDGQRFLSAQPHLQSERDQARVMSHLAQLQAWTYNVVVAPDANAPLLYMHTVNEPTVYNWFNPSPDINYRLALLDGRREYRLSGWRGASSDVQLNVSASYPDALFARGHEHICLDDLEIGSDGSFEIILSSQRHPGNWIELSPASPHNALCIRERFSDWLAEKARFRIEAIDSTSQPAIRGEADFQARMEIAERLVKHAIWERAVSPPQHLPQIAAEPGHATAANGMGSSGGAQFAIRYKLNANEAILMEWNISGITSWGIHLSDELLQTHDFTFRQSSLNEKQAVAGTDNLLRVVISASEPYVQNWLNVGNIASGVVFAEFFGDSNDNVPPPCFRVIPLEQALNIVGEENGITDAERHQKLEARRHGARGRFGYFGG